MAQLMGVLPAPLGASLEPQPISGSARRLHLYSTYLVPPSSCSCLEGQHKPSCITSILHTVQLISKAVQDLEGVHENLQALVGILSGLAAAVALKAIISAAASPPFCTRSSSSPRPCRISSLTHRLTSKTEWIAVLEELECCQVAIGALLIVDQYCDRDSTTVTVHLVASQEAVESTNRMSFASSSSWARRIMGFTTMTAQQIGEGYAVKMVRKIPFTTGLFLPHNFPGTHVTVSRGSSDSCWAVIVVNPIMRRAQELELAKDIVFVDSTASCDATKCTVTVVLSLSQY
ncbi:hypothetical protein HPB49_004255 [Dermacentor silvarum]|uniref:Uncharacterized protein n=1 Tax=Dermacentor silvarum TaxID=543639 RepID=A0ACB8DUS1_DERSI|nr:hypothetical protein HPB49_004255 [Dermacentor silvarum]